ncbi:cysteinyltRNA synthetase [Cyanidiococcus yangmingshanensis]|uniref:cysteine--tRNA ligase n=1 Tax=Cyanidiococcus yangmingshanensis TaxID=2690220 RepID=A0A7J7IHD8_9RHOD|nr:cysteinyltRNA synthetase [Cyanidiococcus yangmingshanensis]
MLHTTRSEELRAAEAWCSSRLRPAWLPPVNEPLHWYQCGPTVYDDAHMGHARTYVTFDMVKRILRDWYRCFPIVAMSITDVDDKIIDRARKEKSPGEHLREAASRIARRFEERFFADLDALGVLRPHFVLRVSEHIPVICAFAQRLLDTDYAYLTSTGDIYFDTHRVQTRYGVLDPGRGLDDGVAAEGIAGRGKRHPADFVLWKAASDPAEDVCWPFVADSSSSKRWNGLGFGRPGWHIECSAMCAHIFGDHLDLHSGGMDLRFPHHENELHLSECYHQVAPWCRHWMHTGTLLVEGEKMAKSRGNALRIRDYFSWGDEDPIHVQRQQKEADIFRLFCAMHRYSLPVEFGEAQRAQAERTWERLAGWFQRSSLDSACDSRSLGSRSGDHDDIHAESVDMSVREAVQEAFPRLRDGFATTETVHDPMAATSAAATERTSPSLSAGIQRHEAPQVLVEWSQACHRALAEAFADDLHLPRAMHALLEFTNQLYRLKSKQSCSEEDVVDSSAFLAASNYLASIFHMLGFQSIPHASYRTASGSLQPNATTYGTREASIQVSPHLVSALVALRARIRQVAKQMNTNQTTKETAPAESLYALSDYLRDDILHRHCSVRVEDRQGTTSRWWFDPSSH